MFLLSEPDGLVHFLYSRGRLIYFSERLYDFSIPRIELYVFYSFSEALKLFFLQNVFLRNTWPKNFGQIFSKPFFYSNRFLHCVRPYCESIFKTVCNFTKKSQNLIYCSPLQPVVVYNSLKSKVTFWH